jgi:hypothetical protein
VATIDGSGRDLNRLRGDVRPIWQIEGLQVSNEDSRSRSLKVGETGMSRLVYHPNKPIQG